MAHLRMQSFEQNWVSLRQLVWSQQMFYILVGGPGRLKPMTLCTQKSNASPSELTWGQYKIWQNIVPELVS